MGGDRWVARQSSPVQSERARARERERERERERGRDPPNHLRGRASSKSFDRDSVSESSEGRGHSRGPYILVIQQGACILRSAYPIQSV